MTNKKLFLVDSAALAYRSHYAFINNPLTTSSGEHTSALYGYVSQILRLIENEKPTHLAIVQDLPKPTFRHKMYKEYKAQRKPMPEELRSQLPLIQEFLDLAGLPSLSREGFEADDLMGTLAVRGEKEGYEVYIFTKDKDMMQVVSDSVFMFEPGVRGQPALVRGPKEVEAKFNVKPEQIVDLLSLMGDAADNIPGVSKVGPKTAATLLKTYGTLERLYENVDNITKKGLRTNLKNDEEMAYLSKRLVQLDCDVEIDSSLEDLAYHPIPVASIEEFLKHWELNSLLGHLPKGGGVPVTSVKSEKKKAVYQLLTIENQKEFVAELEKARVISLDTETTGLDSLVAELVGLCVSTREATGWYVPLGHVVLNESEEFVKAPENFDLENLKILIQPILKSEKQFVFHHAKYDLPILERYGLAPENTSPKTISDTLIAYHIMNPGARGLSLDDLAKKFFDHEMIPIEGLIGKKGKNQKNFSQVPVAEACEYGAEDADITLRLWQRVAPELKNRGQEEMYYGQEIALLSVLQRMEQKGISLNAKRLQELSVEMAKEIERLEKSIYQLAQKEFNISSPQQMSVVLFEELKLKPGKKTKTGFSTDISVLQGLRGEHEIIKYLIEYRELVKLKNTYVDVLPTLVHERTGRIHTSYSQTIAATGRLSSINPNLQNIPIRTEQGRQIRASFVPRSKDYVLLSADYSQIELRVLAHLSGDEGLNEAYQKGVDIHTRTASALYQVSESDVTSEMRRSAKVVNFGVLYGMGPQRLSRELEIPRSEASGFIEKYFERFGHVKAYMKETVDQARKMGYVETISGRRRYLPDLASDNRMVKENAERMAVNTPIQGSAADLIKKAMIEIDGLLAHSSIDCDMLLQVHDELVFEVAKSDVERATLLIKRAMENAMTFSVPLVVEIGIGDTWLESHGG